MRFRSFLREEGDMTYRVHGVLDINFQGLDLNCGYYCLEALMRNRHGNPYGATVTVAPAWNAGNNRFEATYGAAKIAHDPAVLAHMGTWYKIGFDPDDHAAAYGLVPIPIPGTANGWETELRNYGPLIVAGHIGAVRIIPMHSAGHFVLVIGVDANDEIEYLDPLRPWNAYNTGIPTMDVAGFNALAYNVIAAAH